MKKIFAFFCMVFMPLLLLASADEDAIRKVIVNFWLERGSMNIGKALEYCAPEYIETSGEVNYHTLKTLAEHTNTLLTSNDWEAVNESGSWVFTGRVPTEASRAEAKRIKNTPAAREKIAAIRKEFEALRKKSASGIKKITFGGIAVSGNSARADFEGIRHIDSAFLKKVNGKWLLIRHERTDWKRKAAAKKLAEEKAANEKAVTQVLIEHRKALLTLDPARAVTFCDETYQERYSDGTALTLQDLEKVALYAGLMEKSDDLLIVMENALLLQGKKLSDTQREKITALAKSKEAAEVIRQVRENFRKLRQDGVRTAATVKVVKISFSDKNSAQADMLVKDPKSGKDVHLHYQLVKKSDKWLVKLVECVDNK